MAFDTSQYIDLFFQDTEEQLEAMNNALLDLEKNPHNESAIGELFRAAHTLKSSSAMVGFMHVSEFTHTMEDVLQKVRDGETSLTDYTVNVLFKGLDVLKEMLSNLQDGDTEARKNETKRRANELLAQLTGIAGQEEAPSVAPLVESAPAVALYADDVARIEQFKQSGHSIFEINVQMKPNTPMASTRAFLVCSSLRNLGDILKVEPDVINDEHVQLEDHFHVILAAKGVTEDQISAAGSCEDVARVIIDDLTHVALEARREKDASAEHDEAETAETGDAAAAGERREKSRTVRVDIEKLDMLLNLAGELVINRGRALDLAGKLMATNQCQEASELYDNVTGQGMLLSQLQEAIMEARMVPIGQVFTRYRRVVRDLARSASKEVNLVILGEETELDKKIVDEIGEPLTHLVRNAIDHGLEPPEDRVAAGKSAVGTVRFNAYHEGNNIHIEVSDDGRGLNIARIREKAVQRGLYKAEEVEQLPVSDLLQVIFMPGFSTAQKITDVSGRGVGMDVVRRKIDELGGTISIRTDEGKGTCFTIKLPLTLAIIQALLVEVGGETYAIPISSIQETIRIPTSDIFTIEGRGEVLRLREKVVSVLRLSEVLNTPSLLQNGRLYLAIVNQGDHSVGLVVDRMVNEQEIVIKSLGGGVQKGSCIAGASILGNGNVALILDTAALVRTALN